jgi:hypothetical protein
MAGTPPMSQETGHVASDYSPIDMMCEVRLEAILILFIYEGAGLSPKEKLFT